MATMTPVPEAARLLGLPVAGERALVALFMINTLALAVLSGRALDDPLGVMCLGLILAGAIVCSLSAPYPFPASRTILVLVIVLAATLGAALRLPRSGGVDEQAAWHLGTGAFLLLALALRGRVASAWAGMAAMTVITVIWAAGTDDGAAGGLALISRPAGTLLIGTLFAVGITRIAARVDGITAAQAAAAAERAALDAAGAERQRRLDELRTVAGAALEEIASGDDPTGEDRQRYARIEAAVRDGVRGGMLAVPPLSSAAEDTRSRGIDVVLLDDADGAPVDPDAIAAASHWAADRIRNSDRGPVTVRLVASSGRPRLTVSHGDDLEVFEIASDAIRSPSSASE